MNIKMWIKKRIFLLAIIGLVISIGAGTLVYVLMRPYFPEDMSLTGEKDKPQETELPEENFPGWRERERAKALAVVIDNAPEARPQSGLEGAELVYEIPVEGGLTRFLAMITEPIDIVGPIRSTRPYINDLAHEYGAFLVHAGGSIKALENLEKNKNEHLDEINGSKQVRAAFWRSPDRPKPSNLYSSTEALLKAAAEEKYNLNTPSNYLPLVELGEEIDGELVNDITIFYPNHQAEVRYVYNSEDKVFERYTAGKPHLTAKGDQITCANIIVQYVHYHYLDGDGRLQLLMHGEGDALIFREGKVTTAYWKKFPGEFTSFVDKKGDIIGVLPGPTWVQVVTKATMVDY
ncbi:MAG: DUF3048 domain-containing protein [Peptococcia bacterium]